MKRRKVGLRICVSTLLLFLVSASPLFAADNENFAYINRGFYRLLTAVFQVPKYLIEKTMTEPIGLGTVDGALQGAFYSVAAVGGGVLDIARGTTPYAKYLLPFVFL